MDDLLDGSQSEDQEEEEAEALDELEELDEREKEYADLRRDEDVPQQFEDGFGWKAMLGGFFVGFFIVPGSMYIGLMLGQGLGAAADWVTLILFIEIAKRCRTYPSKQEMYIIFHVASGVLGMAAGGLFGGFVHMQYLVQSPAAASFEIAERIPIWVAPPPGSDAYQLRALLHRDWWPHISLMAIGLIWGRLNFYSLGYALFRITSDVERLPFPLAPIAAQGITALAEAEKETWRWRCFSTAAAIGIAFGMIYVAIPTLTGVVFNKPLYIIPIPFIDWTRNFQNIIPAVPVACSTSIGQFFTGFVLPFWMVVGSFVSGVLGQLVLNPILYHVGVLKRWQPGMGVIETGMANSLDFWMSFGVGTAFAVAFIGIGVSIKAVIKAKKAQKGAKTKRRMFEPPKGRGDIPVPVSLLFYVVTTTWTIMLCHWLVPKFPVWLLIVFGFGYTPLVSYISARLVGLTGHRVGFPYVKEASFMLTGYKGIDIWYAPIPLGDAGGGGQSFRQLELTGTKFTSVFKAQFFYIPLAIFCSIFFWTFIWRMGEIPSAAYPYAMRFWPMQAVQRCFWMTATTSGNAFFLEAMKPKFISFGLSYGLIAYFVMASLKWPTLFVYGTIRGLAGNPFEWVPEVTAAFIGRFYFAKKFGPENWKRYTPILAAGFGCGIGLISMVCIAIKLIATAVSQMPF